MPPTAADAGRIAAEVLGARAVLVERMPTGAANWVYDVRCAGGARVVVRILRARADCAAGVHWSRTLRPLGVPLPEMLAHHVGSGEGERSWMVLERLPGTDLEHVYRSLDTAQKRAILDHVLRAQSLVHDLPRATGFGFTKGMEPPPADDTWVDVLTENLETSRRRIERAAVVSSDIVDRVLDRVRAQDFQDVRPIAFLDDTTTRNVLVHDGAFTGIVDVDGLCYGDPWVVTAPTRMALLSRAAPTDYTNAWLDRLRPLGATQRRLDLYAAIFGVNFLGELGEQFNQDAAPAIDPAHVRRFLGIVEDLLTLLN